MGRKYAIRNQQELHFVTFTIVHWIDLFIRNEYKTIITDNLNYCTKHKKLNVHAYCIMTSHVHLILSTHDKVALSDVIRDFKTHTSKTLLKQIESHEGESRKEWLLWMFEKTAAKNKRNSKHQVWLQHNHPIELDTQYILDQRLNYIHMNPVEAGFVNDPNHWLWSSCRDYELNQSGQVNIALL